ncbi:MAG: iron ABC transporter substrate-binding protein [Actinomycetota bacterium]|nr:iron ABC transporter substrate-binding protein [Actinomycetota bacterium]
MRDTRTGTRSTALRLLPVVFIVVALLSTVAACGQAPPENGNSGGENTSGGSGEETTGGETTQAEELKPGEGSLVVYSGRSEELVGPIFEQFEEESGVDVQVRYGDTAELAATILEEGPNSPADLFFAQDPGALGALSDAGLFAELPVGILERVEGRFRSPDNLWVGTSGRARVVAYNTDELKEGDLPNSILDFTDPKWEGRIGWAPTNGSFQAFVTALRNIEGEETTREWLQGIEDNNPFVYPDNSSALEGVASGEVDVAFVNHYYLLRAREEQGEDPPVENYYLRNGDPGALVLVSGAGVLNTAENPKAAEDFLRYALSDETQQYFAESDFEYPLVKGVKTADGVVPLSEIESPDVDLSNLDDLEGTLELLRETGAL